MTSAMDSGVETGNDSNDSLVQEKHLMDLGCIKPKQSFLGTEVENSSPDNPQTSSSTLGKSSDPGTSLTQMLPTSLRGGGYEYSFSSDKNFNCKAHVMFSTPKIGVFVSGGPLGTEFQQNNLVGKVRKKSNFCERRARFRLSETYADIRDTKLMCRAARHNNTQAMQELLEDGISPNRCDGYKRTPLHMAACMGYADMVKLLLEHGADPNAKDSIGNTPLHLAACTNHVNVVTLLLRGGTRVTEGDKSGHSPLQLAITKFNIMKRSIMSHPALKEQVCQVINMLTEYMRHKEGSSLDPDLLLKFESLVRVSDSAEEVESNICDLLNNLNSLSLSGSS